MLHTQFRARYAMQPQSFYQVVTDDFAAVDRLIREQLTSRVPLVETIGDYIISAGGKRLRPLLALLAANALGQCDERACKLAASLEFLHTSTLLHDDVVDKSDLRRGRATANAKWGNSASVLVGDFLYARSFELMVQLESIPVLQVLSNATRVIAEGEVLQLTKVRDASTTEDIYVQVIRAKTAMLFEASTQCAGLLVNAPAEQTEALRQYGDKLGIAFQLMDDLLDYQGDAETLGKNVGDDLAEGKPTLPLIVAMRQGTPEQAQRVRTAIQKGGIEDLDAIGQAVRGSGALDYTSAKARQFAEEAIACLDVLPDSVYKAAMADLARFAVERSL